MGQRIEAANLELRDPEAVQDRLRRSVLALEEMVEFNVFDDHEDTVGFELELDLVESLGGPLLVNDTVLARVARSDLQQELGQFNLELNLAPRPLAGRVFSVLQAELESMLEHVSEEAGPLGARVVAIGTIPTLHPDHVTYDRLSTNPRYSLLADRMREMRGMPFKVDLRGAEHLQLQSDSVAPQAAATSFQLHLRVRPDDFPRFYNAAQVATVIQMATGGNSPYAFGRRLWDETRIPLAEQLLDTRSGDGEGPPRVWIGDHWVGSAIELFAENVRDYSPLFPLLGDEDPGDALGAGATPQLDELSAHGGTIWRWNRPVYDVQSGKPHLRIENRVLPSGPTPPDMVANAALFYGLVRAFADDPTPIWSRWPFGSLDSAFHAGAEHGLEASLFWPGEGEVKAARLALDLLPRAAEGLDAWGIDVRDRDRYLGIIASRISSGRTGAAWQTAATRRFEERGLPRLLALREMTRAYVEYANDGAAVHTWPLP